MPTHWVNYDLNKSGQDYTKLVEYLKSHQSWAKPLKSSFFVQTTLKAGALRDEIKKYIDTNDQVMVVEVTGSDWGSYGVDAKVTEWMKGHI